jgi:integrase
LVDGPEGLVVKDGKTHRAYVVALDPDTVEVLRRHREASRERAALCGVALADGGFVFSFDPDGTRPWRPDTVTHRFTRLREQVGLPKVRLHDIRHYVATRLLAGGVPISTVAGRLGHARASTTLNVYSHFVPATDQAAADLLASLLTSTTRADPPPGG